MKFIKFIVLTISIFTLASCSAVNSFYDAFNNKYDIVYFKFSDSNASFVYTVSSQAVNQNGDIKFKKVSRLEGVGVSDTLPSICFSEDNCFLTVNENIIYYENNTINSSYDSTLIVVENNYYQKREYITSSSNIEEFYGSIGECFFNPNDYISFFLPTHQRQFDEEKNPFSPIEVESINNQFVLKQQYVMNAESCSKTIANFEAIFNNSYEFLSSSYDEENIIPIKEPSNIYKITTKAKLEKVDNKSKPTLISKGTKLDKKEIEIKWL